MKKNFVYRRCKTYLKLFGLRRGFKPAVLELFGIERECSLYYPPIEREILFRTRTNDILIFRQVFHKKEYDFKIGKAPQFIVDAGANVGYAALYFASRYPMARIYSIEAEPANYKQLVKNTAGLANVTAINAALWNRESSIEIFERKGSGGFSIFDTEKRNKRVVSVPAITVDKLMREHDMPRVDILKVDIEGAEKEVFQQADDWIASVGVVVAEMHERINPGCKDAYDRATRDFEHKERMGENWLAFRADYIDV